MRDSAPSVFFLSIRHELAFEPVRPIPVDDTAFTVVGPAQPVRSDPSLSRRLMWLILENIVAGVTLMTSALLYGCARRSG